MTDVTELAGKIAALPHLPLADRARQARDLIDLAKTALSQVGDQATAELAGEVGYKAAAGALGVSEATINKAVTRHRSRSKA
ncbi:hypothetical protein [Actinoplanes sp. NPDC048796]|uniref:hypothetical protein n=1 Tax=Actinoplanes sp. NPDC048796 TaxID=3155640 RepID=UPI00340B7CEE